MTLATVAALARELDVIESIVFMTRAKSTLDLLTHATRECSEAELILPPSIVIANEQTEGVGREGRVWSSPSEGGLYASLSFRTTTERAATIPLEVGLLAARVAALAGASDVGLKWPNDLYVQGRKLGGVLLRARQADNGVDVVAGVGINIEPVADVDTAVSLSEISDSSVTLESLQEAFIREADRMLANDYDRGSLLDGWRSMTIHSAGDRIVFNAGGAEISGIWEGIDGDGRAMLNIDGQSKPFSAGEIVDWETPEEMEEE